MGINNSIILWTNFSSLINKARKWVRGTILLLTKTGLKLEMSFWIRYYNDYLQDDNDIKV